MRSSFARSRSYESICRWDAEVLLARDLLDEARVTVVKGDIN